LATQDGLFVYTPGDRRLQRVLRADGAGLTGDVYTLAEDADGSLLAGGVQGLFRITPGDTRLQPVVSPADEGLGNPIVLGLLLDNAGRLWVDTAVAGLHLRLPGDGPPARFDRISLRHGVRNRPFGANLLADRRGRIWTQMYVYDPADDSLTELTAADGADMGTGWFLSYAQLTDGRFVFGGSKGLLVVEPEQFEPARYAPPVRVSGLRINGQPASMAGLAEGLNIRPGQRNFSVEFTALDYADPQRTRFSYRLEGVDPDWIATSADFRQASYGNLAPGSYVLRVRASNRAGVWNPEALTLPVRVWPAWWQTGWWRTLVALLGIGLSVLAVSTLVRRRTKVLQARQAALAKEVAERTAELSHMAETLRERSAALEQASLTDPLTLLHNRRHLSQHIDADCALAVRQWSAPQPGPGDHPVQADLVFFLCDIDHFKGLNDHHGHAAGDAVLRQMRQRLQQVFRDSDHLVRWGGEEFLIVARSTSRASAAELADRLRHAVADVPMTLDDGTPCPVSVSTGFAAFPASTSHPEALGWEDTVAMADAALLAVKRARRGEWAGVLQIDGDSSATIQAAARLPAERWATSHQLSWVASVALHPANDR
jgi:diguanylate cyclase (GGDEF)-like protein